MKRKLTIKNYINFVVLFFRLAWCAWWYKGIDHPTMWQRIYWRVSLKTAFVVAKRLCLT